MLRLRTLGGLALVEDDRALSGSMAQRRRLALLALLSRAGTTGLTRDKLVAMLWPESDAPRARHALSQLLFLLRKDLPDSTLGAGGGDALVLDTSVLPVDVVEMEAALKAGDAEAAASLYAGPFLDGFHLSDVPEFERWVDGERATLQSAWRGALASAARARAARGDAAGAVDAWRRLANADPTSARVAQGYMRALDAQGDRAAAIAHARVYAAIVREELGAPPDPAVAALAEELQRAPAAPMASSAASASGASGAGGEEMVMHPAASGAIVNSGGAPLAAASTPHAPAVPTPPSFAGARRARRRRRRLLPLTLGAAIVTVLGAWVATPPSVRATTLTLLTRAPAALDARRVVVAPFENETGDRALDAFGEMNADWVTQSLGRVGEFDVVDARTAMATAYVVDGIPRPLRTGDRAVALAQETGSRTLISGRYYRERDSIRVHVRLTDVQSGRVLRSYGPVSGTANDLAALVDHVSRRAVAMLAAAVDTTPAGQGIGRTAPPSYEAFRETTRAWEQYYRSDLPAAFEHAYRAAALDSSYALPLMMAAFFHTELMQWRQADSLLRLVAPRSGTLARLEQASYDLVASDVRGDYDAALRNVQELARATPASSEVATHVAHIAVAANQPRVALAALSQLDPRRGLLLLVPFYWNWRASAEHELGDFRSELASAEAEYRQFPTRDASLLGLARARAALGDVRGATDLAGRATNERWDSRAMHVRVLLTTSRELRAHGHDTTWRPILAEVVRRRHEYRDSSAVTLEQTGLVLAEAAQWSEARAVLERALQLDATRLAAHGALGVVAARTGDRTVAMHEDSVLAAWPPALFPRGRHAAWRARIAAALGDTDRAIDLLAQSLTLGIPMLQGFQSLPGTTREFDFAEFDVHNDPWLEGVRGNPRYVRLVAPR